MDTTDNPETYPYKMGHLPPKFVKKAERELHEKPGTKELAIKQVKDFLRRECGVKEEWFSDEVITMFLRCRKFDVFRTCSSIKRMVKYIRSHPKFFRPIAPEIVDEMIRTKMITIMPYRDKDGCTICNIKLGQWDPSEFTYEDVIKLGAMVFTSALNDPMTQVNGIKVIYDFEASFLRYVRYITPFILYELYQLLFDCIPMRVKEMHCVNPNGVAKLALPLIMMFVPEKIKKRLSVYRDHSQLLEHLQANVVPQEYGGKLTKSERNDSCLQQLSMPSYITAILNSSETSNETS